MAKVFISYSHDSDLHKQRVLLLAAQLGNLDNLEVLIDQNVLPGGPNEGWDHWSEAQIRNSDRVLMVCTERYCARYEGRETTGQGLGATAEARLIHHFLHDAGGNNLRFRVVLLDASDEQHVPDTLKTYQCFRVYQPGGLNELISWLTSSPQTNTKSAQVLWPPAPLSYIWDMAGRTGVITRLTQMLSGQSDKRILLLSAASNSGKTLLLSQLRNYAKTLAMARAHFNCKGSPSLDELVDLVALDLETVLPIRPKSATDLIGKLQHLIQPVLLTFDTYEQSSASVQTWIEGQLLERLDNCPAVAVVIAGQQIPVRAKQLWSSLADEDKMGPIDDPHDWLTYVHRKGNPHFNLDHLRFLTNVTGGNPGNVSALIDRVRDGSKAIAKLKAVQTEPQKLTLATLDIVLSSEIPEIRRVFEAAAIPHWFTKSTLANLLTADDLQAAEYVERLQRLPMVEPFPARQGWNVHEATRLVLRAQLAAEKPEQFRRLSSQAAALFTGAQPSDRVERLFHLFAAQSPDAPALFSELWNEWYPNAPDHILALGAAILELDTTGSPFTGSNDFRNLLAGRYLDLSDIARSFGKGRLAQTYTQTAATVLQHLIVAEPDRGKFHRNLAASYDRLGDLACDQGQSVSAKAYFEKSLQIADRLAATEPGRADLQRELSLCYNRLGVLAAAEGQPEAGRDYFLKALHIRRRLAQAEPDNADFQRDLCVSIGRLGDFARSQGESQSAQDYFEESLAIAERLAQSQSGRVDLQRDLSVLYNKLGDLARQQPEIETAQTYFLKSLAIRERLAQAEPGRADLQRDLSICYEKLGVLACSHGQPEAAEDYFQKSFLIRERLAEAEPDRADLQRDLSVSLFKLGELAATQHQSQASQKYLQRSLAVLEALQQSGRMRPSDEPHLAMLREQILKARTASPGST